MKALERLHDARAAMQERDYERALEQMIWFHNHALQEDYALRGVRLSFALADWIELGEFYPKALQVLRSIRDEKTAQLLVGSGDRQEFIDVSAINEYLEEEAATYSLFVEVRKNDASLADECSRQALPSMVAARDFVLAKEVYGDPVAFLRSLSDSLNEDIDWAREGACKQLEATLDAFVSNYVEDVGMLLSTFAATDGGQRRKFLANLAIEQIKDTECQAQIVSGIGS